MKHQVHIPRTGGSALAASLRGTGWHHEDHRYRLEHVPQGDKALVIVRDPISRFLSLHAWAVRGAYVTDDLEQDANAFALDMEGSLLRLREAWAMLWHPLTWWLRDADYARSRFAYILHTESLDADVARMLGTPQLPRTGPAKHSALTPQAQAALVQWYARDYVLLRELG